VVLFQIASLSEMLKIIFSVSTMSIIVSIAIIFSEVFLNLLSVSFFILPEIASALSEAEKLPSLL
jgi:hypothetical protein